MKKLGVLEVKISHTIQYNAKIRKTISPAQIKGNWLSYTSDSMPGLVKYYDQRMCKNRTLLIIMFANVMMYFLESL